MTTQPAPDESYKLDEIGIRVPDVENLLEVLKLVHSKQQAEDLAKCYNNLVDVRYSPLTEEVGATIARVDGHLQDYWASKGRAVAIAQAAEEDVDEASEEELEPLPTKPFGAVEIQRAPMMEFTDEPVDEPEDAE